jgi:lysophospholipase L1-like esterase
MKSVFFLLIGLLWSCTEAQMTKPKSKQDPVSFLALGDSYTIGEAVPIEDRWPVQLVKRLRGEDLEIMDPKIIAKTGWTTDELQSAIKIEQPSSDYDLVSLLIGVNNQYRGYDIAQYEKEFEELVDQAISFAGGDNNHVFVLSIPDYGITPFAKNRGLDAEKIAMDLNAYNQLASTICNRKEVQFFEITEWSRNADSDLSLIASDELHPSGKMYENWVDTCFDWVSKNLNAR